MKDIPLLSILCVTYNHCNFIDATIKGFLMQKTKFKFEILIHDDASIDNNVKIIKKYEKKYPNIIKVIYQKENQFSKGIKPLWEFLYPKARGKYIALCEGDDYWTDPEKLQKQVDFLENNPEYVISGHDAIIIDENGNKISDNLLNLENKKDFSQFELMSGNVWIPTLSMVFRKVFDSLNRETCNIFTGDRFLTCFLGQFGKSHFHSDIKPGVYRKHNGGIWSSLSQIEQYEINATSFIQISQYFRKVNKQDVANVLFDIATSNIMKREKLLFKNKPEYHLEYKLIVKGFTELLQLDKSKEYFLYGYGTLGKAIHKFLGDRVIGILDKELSKNKTTNINNTKVYHEIPNNLNENQFVLITPYIYAEEIKRTLSLDNDKIIVFIS